MPGRRARLRAALFREHLGVDSAQLDDRAALALFRDLARANRDRRARGEPLRGLAFALDPARYGASYRLATAASPGGPHP